MIEKDEKIPSPKEIEKEINEFLSKKFGGSVKMVSPLVVPQESTVEDQAPFPQLEHKLTIGTG